jgi:hypothetical protein
MGGKSLYLDDAGADGILLAVDSDDLGPVKYQPAQRALRLVTDEQDRAFRS